MSKHREWSLLYDEINDVVEVVTGFLLLGIYPGTLSS